MTGSRERLQVLNGGGLTSESLVSGLRDGRRVIGESVLPDFGLLEFEARDIRQTPTGVHARITITTDGRIAAFTVMNTERDEDRVRLANAAARRMGLAKDRNEAVKVRLDQFCGSLWEWWTQALEAQWTPGAASDDYTRWLLDPFVVERGGTILFGPPGGGKSWTALAWAMNVHHGRGPWGDMDPRRVVFVNLERPAHSVARRVRDLGRIFGIDEPGLDVINGRGLTLASVHDVVVRAAEGTKETPPAQLIIVDSLSRAGAGDLNTNEAANSAMDLLNATGAAWVCIAHSPRADSTHVYGSVMLDAAADLCVRLQSSYGFDERVMGVQLEVTKANDVPRGRPQTWALGFANSADGGASHLASWQVGEQADFPELTSVTTPVSQLVRDYLMSEGKATASEIADAIGRDHDTVKTTLNRGRGRRFNIVEPGGGRGKTAVWGLGSLVDE